MRSVVNRNVFMRRMTVEETIMGETGTTNQKQIFQ
jgi:hypothetical protein